MKNDFVDNRGKFSKLSKLAYLTADLMAISKASCGLNKNEEATQILTRSRGMRSPALAWALHLKHIAVLHFHIALNTRASTWIRVNIIPRIQSKLIIILFYYVQHDFLNTCELRWPHVSSQQPHDATSSHHVAASGNMALH